MREKYLKGEGKLVPVLSIDPLFNLSCKPFPVGLFGVAFDFFQGLPAANRHDLVSAASQVSQPCRYGFSQTMG